MTRRSFFPFIAACCASLGLSRPKRAEAEPVLKVTKVRYGKPDVEKYVYPTNSREWYAIKLAKREVLRKRYPYPVIYDGDLLDPRYKLAGMTPHARLRVGKLYIDGVDRTKEAYESFEGENGWANLYLKDADGRVVRLPDGDVLHYSVRGKVEWVDA